MSRCLSIESQQQIVLDGGAGIEEMQSSDSDEELDVVDIKHKDSSPPESKRDEKKVNVGPVLSVQCLHKDNDENGGTMIEFLDIDNVPVLQINSDQEDEEMDSNHKPLEEKEKDSNHKPLEEKGEDSNHKPLEEKAEDSNHKSLEEEEEHPHLVPLTKNALKSTTSEFILADRPHSSIPARNNWEGAHNFKIMIEADSTHRKAEQIVFSEELNKLYIIKDHPFKLLVNAENVPADSVIRVTAIFTLVEHAYEVVRRCPTHAQQDFHRGVAYYEHFVQCFSDAAVYEKNPKNNKLSVTVLYKKPQEGEKFSMYLFKLTCFSSCLGGINRRPFKLMFTLEKDNIPLGRQTINAKVCACPVRDFKLEKTKQDKNESKTETEIENDNTESSESNPEDIPQKYSIVVKDPELYLFLKQMKALYEAGASHLPQVPEISDLIESPDSDNEDEEVELAAPFDAAVKGQEDLKFSRCYNLQESHLQSISVIKRELSLKIKEER